VSDDRVIVVGAGPNGLAAAVALAREGFEVTVHEAADRIGGGASTRELTLPGFRHDVCSAVHPMGAGSPFFRELPLAEHGLEWIHPPVLLAHPFDDGTAALLLHSTADTAESLGADDGGAYRRLMDPFVADWRAVFDQALAPLVRLPRRPFLMSRLARLGMRSGLGLSRRWFASERARAFFMGVAAHALVRMDRPPSAAFAIMLALAGHGPGWPVARSGSQSVSDALAGLLAAHGGRILTGARVSSIDALPPARATLLDLTTRQVLEVAGHRLPKRYRGRLERFRYGPGACKVDWALSQPIPWKAPECRRAGTLHLGPTVAEIVASTNAAWEGRPDATPFVLLSQPTLFDPSRAPEGRHVAWAYCHVPHGSPVDMTRAIERQVERFAPGFGDTILARHTFTAPELEAHDANLVGGDINGGVQDVAQLLFRPAPRLDPYATPVEGLFLCSASTPPGGGVHGMCGFNAARSVLARVGRSRP